MAVSGGDSEGINNISVKEKPPKTLDRGDPSIHGTWSAKEPYMPEITVGHVLELLLSSVYLHRSATSTLTKLLGRENGDNKAPANAQQTVSSSNPPPPTSDNSNNQTSSATATNAANGKVTDNQPNVRDLKDLSLFPSEIWNRLFNNPATRNPETTMKMFNKIIEDGLLDSILPYIVSSLNLSQDPSVTIFPMVEEVLNKTTTESEVVVKSEEAEKATETLKQTRSAVKKKDITKPEEKDVLTPGSEQSLITKDEASGNSSQESTNDNGPPIVIHVCDEAHGLRQDFTCSRDSLINHIGYFAEVTAGQRLEDVDISVHCDISIFDWLLKWVKKQDSATAKAPILEPKNATSILISADFLKMSPLADEVLKYIHDNTNRILEAQLNMSSLTDALLTKLARLFNHWELESLRDPKDKLQNKLYARFVQMLCDVNPLPSKGIFRTAACIHRCSECGKIISRNVERLIDCLPSNTCVTTTGSVYYTHSRDVNWNLTEHVKFMKTELRFWRWVYWRLWGQVHFLPCSTCAVVFPGSEMKLCRCHRCDPSFGMENISPLILSGGETYPCCGARALRFSPLPLRNGCQYTEHTVQLTRRHSEIWGPIPQIYDDLLTFQHLICLEPRVGDVSSQKVIWKGVSLIPPSRMERSFLDRSWLSEHRAEKGSSSAVEKDPSNDTKPQKAEETIEDPQGILQRPISDCDSESSEDEEEGVKRRKKRTITPRMKTMLLRKATKIKRTVAYEVASEPGWRWDTTRSTRYNQDAQRDRELRVFRELTAWLAMASPTAPDVTPVNPSKARHKVDKNRKESVAPGPDPGSFYKLECEFKDKFGTHDKSHGFVHPGGTFRAKVQAISRIKMRLRHRAAFSATR